MVDPFPRPAYVDGVVNIKELVVQIYITKFALAQGILVAEAEVSPDSKMATTCQKNRATYNHFHGKDWHYTLEEAEKRVDEMIRKKVDAARKALKKLEDPKTASTCKKTSPLYR